MPVVPYDKQNLRDYFLERSTAANHALEELSFTQFNHGLEHLLDDINREMEGILSLHFDRVERDTQQIVLSCFSNEHSSTIFIRLNLELDNNMRHIGLWIEPLNKNNYDSTIYKLGMSDQQECLKKAMIGHAAVAFSLDNARRNYDKHIKLPNKSWGNLQTSLS